jgi:hypothetical protein
MNMASQIIPNTDNVQIAELAVALHIIERSGFIENVLLEDKLTDEERDEKIAQEFSKILRTIRNEKTNEQTPKVKPSPRVLGV